MAIPFEEYVDRMNKARSVDELLQVFLETVGQHGYDKMIFCLLSDHKQIGLAAGVGHLRNYPADWMQYYFEQSFDQIRSRHQLLLPENRHLHVAGNVRKT